DNMPGWCLIESDPGIFTEMLLGFGVSGAQVEEIWSLDAGSFQHLQPIHGLIFLFKWLQDDQPSGVVVTDRQDIFFARQVVNNACATQAILSILLNLKHADIDIGPTLTNFKGLCEHLDFETRGLCLAHQTEIRNVHNSFARPMFFEFDIPTIATVEDAYHFVGFVPINGKIFELDGLREGPIEVADIPQGGSWLEVAGPIIEARMQRYSAGEIHFNLMAVVSDRQRNYERQIAMLLQEPSLLGAVDLQIEIANLESGVQFEKEKKIRYKEEHQRRRTSYVPFIMELLRQLGETGQLMDIYNRARNRAVQTATFKMFEQNK
ncbi:hypothetical protein KR018_010552, partial [Drosophila ironensis]